MNISKELGVIGGALFLFAAGCCSTTQQCPSTKAPTQSSVGFSSNSTAVKLVASNGCTLQDQPCVAPAKPAKTKLPAPSACRPCGLIAPAPAPRPVPPPVSLCQPCATPTPAPIPACSQCGGPITASLPTQQPMPDFSPIPAASQPVVDCLPTGYCPPFETVCDIQMNGVGPCQTYTDAELDRASDLDVRVIVPRQDALAAILNTVPELTPESPKSATMPEGIQPLVDATEKKAAASLIEEEAAKPVVQEVAIAEVKIEEPAVQVVQAVEAMPAVAVVQEMTPEAKKDEMVEIAPPSEAKLEISTPEVAPAMHKANQDESVLTEAAVVDDVAIMPPPPEVLAQPGDLAAPPAINADDFGTGSESVPQASMNVHSESLTPVELPPALEK